MVLIKIILYEKKNKLSQPSPILIKISARLSHAFYRNNINEKCAIFLKNTHFCVLQNIGFICPFETISDAAAFTF